MTLLDLGFRDVFDVIYGASAGAINSTFYLSGERRRAGWHVGGWE